MTLCLLSETSIRECSGAYHSYSTELPLALRQIMIYICMVVTYKTNPVQLLNSSYCSPKEKLLNSLI